MADSSDLNDKPVPKHPWEQPVRTLPHANLAANLSLPTEAERQARHVGPNLMSPCHMAAHLPVSRASSDSIRYHQKRGKDKLASSRRKLESEDSSYDSDHDLTDFQCLRIPNLQISRSHDDVSRTSSETLRAEFEEYITRQPSLHANSEQSKGTVGTLNPYHIDRSVHYLSLETIIQDPSYNANLEFALRLGYTEQLLQKALMKVGHGVGENQLLEELIRLQKSSVGKEIVSSDSISSNVTAKEALNDTAAVKSDLTESELLPIVIDGSNVAMSHGNKDIFSCKGIRICVSWFQNRGHKDITVFVPLWRKEASRPETPITDQYILLEMEKERILTFTPSRQVQGKRYVCHDDRYILNLAAETGAIVVSNDNYRDLINEKPDFKRVIEEKILMYSFVNDRFMPPDDPLGRNGPTLDAFLRRKPVLNDVQPCPYGKKCTYGNKCKYFHPDRGNQPKKSITDKLKEHSSQKINEVRARDQNSRDSSPGEALTRTRSLQPFSHASENSFMPEMDKQLLCRTRSTLPHLTASSQISSETRVKYGSSNIGGQFTQHTTGPLPLMNIRLPPPVHQREFNDSRMQSEGNGGRRDGNASQQQQAWKQFTNFRAEMVDTSVPPPLNPWAGQAMGPESQVSDDVSGNLHKKLARQLTLNPAYDPRIHRHSFSSQPPSFRYPPPNITHTASLKQQQPQLQNDDHAAVTRNASAPEKSNMNFHPTVNQNVNAFQKNSSVEMQGNRGMLSGAFVSQSNQVHADYHSSMSETNLSNQGSSNLRNQGSSPTPTMFSGSPLILPSAMVWKANSSLPQVADFSEMRSNLYYHLAAIFPEEQVLLAMRAHPEETDPQVICQYILSLNKAQQMD